MRFQREDGEVFDFSVNCAAGMQLVPEEGELELSLDDRPAWVDVAVGVLTAPDALDPGDLAALVRLMVPPIVGSASNFLPGFAAPDIDLGALSGLGALEGQVLSLQDPELEVAEGAWVVLTGTMGAE